VFFWVFCLLFLRLYICTCLFCFICFFWCFVCCFSFCTYVPVSFLFLYKSTERYHLGETHLQYIKIILYNICIKSSPPSYFSTVSYLHQINGTIHIVYKGKKKGKAVPLQAWSGPEVSRKLRFPDFVTVAQDGGRLSALRTGRLYPQEILLVLISVRG